MKLQKKNEIKLPIKVNHPKIIIRMRIVLARIWLFYLSLKWFIKWKNQCLVLLCFFVDNNPSNRAELRYFLNNFPKEYLKMIRFCFDENMSYGTYIQYEIFIQSLKIEHKEEFIY